MKKNLLRTFARSSMFLVCGGCLVFSPLASMSAETSLHEKEPFDFYKIPLQDIIVKGKVTDAKGPIPGVSVKLKGGSATTVTDGSGNFSIKVPEDATLVFTYVGYVDQEVQVKNQTNINVRLSENNQNLSEVVVVGYGTQKKAVVSGAVASVKGTELAKSSSVNLTNSLAGRLPGVTALQGSGEPGYDGSTIRIRGTNSLGNNNALIVIDGIPNRAGGIERLNPNDIESV